MSASMMARAVATSRNAKPWTKPLVSGALVGILAALGYAWTLDLPFQLDDYTVIPKSETFLTERPKSHSGDAAYLFRPVLWTWLKVLTSLSKPPLDPMVFHGAAWLLHVLTSLIVLALFRGLLPPAAALLGAGFFAIHPGGHEAVAWIAAGGDLFVVLFGALAFMCLLRPGPWWCLAGGLALAGALLSKATAFAFLPLLGVLLLWRLRRESQTRLLRIALVTLPLIAAVLLRGWYLGTFRLGYAGGSGADASSLARMFEVFPSLLKTLLLPWKDDPSLDAVVPRLVPLEGISLLLLPHQGRWGLIALTLSLPLGALLLSPRWFGQRLILGMMAFATLAAPAAFAAPRTDVVFSRALYSVFVPVAAIYGAATWAWLRQEGTLRRWLGGGFLVLTMALQVDALVHVARAMRLAGSRVLEHVERLEGVLVGQDGPVAVVIVDDAARGFSSLGGIPLLGPLVSDAFAPPFRAEGAFVKYFPSERALTQSGILFQRPCPVPLAILRLRDGHLVEDAPAWPALPEQPPQWRVEAANEGVVRWIPDPPFPGRSGAGLVVFLPPGPGECRVVVRTDGGLLSRTVGLGPERTSIPWVLDEEPLWVWSREVREVAILGGGNASPKAPQLLLDVPKVLIHEPKEGAEAPISEVPWFHIRGLAEASPLRLEATFGTEELDIVLLTQSSPEALKPVHEGAWRYRPSDADRVVTARPADLKWSSLAGLFHQHLGSRGVKELSVACRIVVLDPSGMHPRARSPWVRFALRR